MSEPTVTDSGLTPEEQAQFEAMAAADGVVLAVDAPLEPPAGGNEPPADVAGQAAAAAAAAAAGQQPPAGQAQPAVEGQQPPAGQPTPESGDDEDDGTDEVTQADDGKPEPKRVSYAKHKRITDALKQQVDAAAAEKTRLAEERARLEERVNIIAQALQPPAPVQGQEQPDPMPDPNEDIVAFTQWQAREMGRMGRVIQQLQQGHQQVQQTQQQGVADLELRTAYRNDAIAFVQQQPDFGFAYRYLMNHRLQELEAAGITDEAQRRKMVSADEMNLVKAALKPGPDGRPQASAAQRLYAMAKLRGYDPAKHGQQVQAAPAVNGQQQPPAQQQPAQQQPPVAANGQQQQPAPAPNVAEELERIRKGVQSGTSLSDGGGAPAVNLTPQALLAMPDEEFAALVEKLPASRQMDFLGH